MLARTWPSTTAVHLHARPAYTPRDPHGGVLHPLVERWWPELVTSIEGEGGTIPDFVKRAVERYLPCGDASRGFIHLRCPDCGTERALAFSCKVRGLCPSCGARRMHDDAHHLVTRVLPDVPIRQYVLSPPGELVGLLAARGDALAALGRIFVEEIFAGIRRRIGGQAKQHPGSVCVVQRFSKTLSAYPHLHVLVLDGAYVETEDETVSFIPDTPLSDADVAALEDRVQVRFTMWLSRHGHLSEDQPEKDTLDVWWLAAAHEPSGIIASVGIRRPERFDVHARVCVAAGDEKGREQLCRYVLRPPFAEEQLEVLDEERVCLTFRSPLRNGQRELILHPLALMRRLAWLVPPSGQHQIRYSGVLAPAARLRPAVVPAGRVSIQGVWFAKRSFVPPEPVPYRARWSALLARVYEVDGHACPACPGRLRPVRAVLPPHAKTWIDTKRIEPLLATSPLGTGPPPDHVQLSLPIAS